MKTSITIEQLKCFIAVSKEMNFRKAAKNLNISQPPVTRHIVNLEYNLKTKLFEKQAKRTKAEERVKILDYQKKASENKKNLKLSRDEKLMTLLKDQISNGIRSNSSNRTLIKKSTKLTLKRLSSFDLERFAQDVPWVEDKKVWNKIVRIWVSFRKEWARIETQLEREVFKLKVGDELQLVFENAKVYVAQKRKLQVGDKMAGRHEIKV